MKTARYVLLLVLTAFVLGCDSGGIDPLDPSSEALIGTWTLQNGTVDAFVTTRMAERVVRQGEGQGGIEISGLDRPLRYLEYHQGGEVGDTHEDVHHQISLRSHPYDHYNEALICSLHLQVSERIRTGPGAPPLFPPSLSFSCQEDAQGNEWSSFDLAEETIPSLTFDGENIVLDLPNTTLFRVSTAPSVLGEEITLQGRFEAGVIRIPAGVSTQVPMPFEDVPVMPLGARLTLDRDGTYESVYQGPGDMAGEPDGPIIERGRWWVENDTITMEPREIGGIDLAPGQLLTGRYEQSGRALRLFLDVRPCQAAPDPSDCLANATGTFQFRDYHAATDLRLDLMLRLERQAR